jgi:PAS domain-containing protein
MKVVALISWYDERPSWLAATVASLKDFADHIIAVDGAYLLYPGGRPASSSDQAETIQDAAATLGIGCTIHTPSTVWLENETEKRSFMFALAETMTTEEDWYFPIDADEVCTYISPGTRELLEATDLDAADINLWNRSAIPDRDDAHEKARQFVWEDEEQHPHRQIFRAIRGLKVEGTHYHYVTPDGRQLWGSSPVDGLDLTQNVSIEHRNTQRTMKRDQNRILYYERRDRLGIECAPS